MKRYKLNRHELKIEDALDEYVAVSPDEKKRIMKSAAGTRTISLRINEEVLERIKERAAEEGLSYQTLISSILYKYSTNRLIDGKSLQIAVASLRNKA
ncbi:MAG TPA: CopG family antitoxin [Spirochaetota bacterium]|nr:CopG family antitoxin [Spirochaetota bacterium]